MISKTRGWIRSHGTSFAMIAFAIAVAYSLFLQGEQIQANRETRQAIDESTQEDVAQSLRTLEQIKQSQKKSSKDIDKVLKTIRIIAKRAGIPVDGLPGQNRGNQNNSNGNSSDSNNGSSDNPNDSPSTKPSQQPSRSPKPTKSPSSKPSPLICVGENCVDNPLETPPKLPLVVGSAFLLGAGGYVAIKKKR